MKENPHHGRPVYTSGDEFCTNSARGCRFCTEMHVSYSLHVVLYVSVQMYSSWKIDLRSVLHVPVTVQMYSSWKIDLRSALRHHRLCCVLLRIPEVQTPHEGRERTKRRSPASSTGGVPKLELVNPPYPVLVEIVLHTALVYFVNLHAPMNMTQVSSQVWNGGLECAIDIRIILASTSVVGGRRCGRR